MQTLTLLVVGLIMLAAFYSAGRMIGAGGRRGSASAMRIFLPVWLIASLANLAIAHYVAERALWSEILLFVVIFGMPASPRCCCCGALAQTALVARPSRRAPRPSARRAA